MNTLAHYAATAKEQVGDREWVDAVNAAEPQPRPRRRLDELNTSHPRVKTAVQRAREWGQRKRDGFNDASLVLAGPFGTGKTHIAQAILWSIVDVPEDHPDLAVPAGKFFLANDLLLRLAPTKDDESGIITVTRPSHLLGTAPIVVVDDVGGQQMLPYIAAADQESELYARWFTFINHCYTLGTSVIITTNLSLDGGHKSQLARHLGGRAWDRLCQMAPAGFMISLDGVPSWRVKAGGR